MNRPRLTQESAARCTCPCKTINLFCDSALAELFVKRSCEAARFRAAVEEPRYQQIGAPQKGRKKGKIKWEESTILEWKCVADSEGSSTSLYVVISRNLHYDSTVILLYYGQKFDEITRIGRCNSAEGTFVYNL